MDALFPIAFNVHAGIVDVEGRDPEGHAQGDGQDGGRPQGVRDGGPAVHVGGHGHPSARRSQTETEAEPEVAQPREALHVWIDDEGQDRQPGHHQRHPVQQAGTDEEHREEDGRQDPRRLHAHAA